MIGKGEGDFMIRIDMLDKCSLSDLFSLDDTIRILSISEYYSFLKENKEMTEEEYFFDSENLMSYCNYRKNLPIYQETEYLYNCLLEEILESIDTLFPNKSPLFIAKLTSHLILEGYLSYTKKFHRYNPKCMDSFSFAHLGYYIPAGYGVCKNFNSFIGDVLAKKGIPSYKIGCCIGKESDDIEKIRNTRATHFVTGLIQNKKFYLIDPYNNFYSWEKKGNVFLDSYHWNAIMPWFDKSLIGFLQEEEYRNLFPLSCSYDEEEVELYNREIEEFMSHGGKDIFKEFKDCHSGLLEKLAFLVPLEFERTLEKENQKVIR